VWANEYAVVAMVCTCRPTGTHRSQRSMKSASGAASSLPRCAASTRAFVRRVSHAHGEAAAAGSSGREAAALLLSRELAWQ
jgi:hypothetical protein